MFMQMDFGLIFDQKKFPKKFHVDVTIVGCSLDRKVTIDCNLLWQPHITELTMKIPKYIPFFYNIRKKWLGLFLELSISALYIQLSYMDILYGDLVDSLR